MVEKKFAGISLLIIFIYALVISLSENIFFLLACAVLPVLLFFWRKPEGLGALKKINLVNLFMIVTLALTWPNFWEGLIRGLIIAFRVNMVYIVFAALILPQGAAGIYKGLKFLKAPEKIIILILLTMRGIYILNERLDSALISARLRAHGLKGLAKFKVFAYITASILLQGSEKSERVMTAITCRGGFEGFNLEA